MADNKVQLIIEALDRTKGAFKEIGKNLEGLRSAALSAAANIATLAAPFIAVAAAIKQTANAGEEYLKVSKQMGISVENISTLKYAAEQSEASFEDLTSGMKFFSKALYGVNDEGKDTTVLLKQLGVTAKDPYQALLQTADAFSEMEDGSGKAAISMHLFGRGGLAMITMLNEGSEGIKKLQGEVKEFSKAAAKAGDDFNDNLNRLKRNIMDIVHALGNELIPKLNALFNLFEGGDKTKAAIITLFGSEEDKKSLARFKEAQERLKKAEDAAKPKQAAPLLPDKKETEEWPNALRQLQAQLAATTPGVSEFAKKEAAVDKTIGDLIQKFPKHTKQLREFQEALKANITGQNEYEARKAYTDSIAKIDEALKQHQIESLKQISAEESKQYNERLTMQQSTVESIIKSSEDIAVARAKITGGELAGQLKQYDIEKQHIMETAQGKLSATDITAKEVLQIEQEKYAALMNLDLRYRDALLASNASLTEGLSEGFKKYTQELRTTFQQGVEIARATASAMEGAFSDFFFDAFQGKMKTLADYLRSFLTSVQRALAQAMSQKLVGSIISSIGGLGSTPNYAASSSTGFAATGSQVNMPMHSGGLVMHEGGYIPRFHFGGLSSDEVPAILQRGEYVVSRKGVAAMDAINRGDVSQSGGTQEVHNYYYIQAVDAKSFADLVERNPGAITKIMQDDARRGGSLWR